MSSLVRAIKEIGSFLFMGFSVLVVKVVSKVNVAMSLFRLRYIGSLHRAQTSLTLAPKAKVVRNMALERNLSVLACSLNKGVIKSSSTASRDQSTILYGV